MRNNNSDQTEAGKLKKVLVDEQRCKQCGICVSTCPKKAIKFSEDINMKGYQPVVVDQEACIGCGICYTMCPDWVYEIIGDRG